MPHRLNARRFKTTACRLKGANVKIGQLASMQAHLLPPEYVEELRSLAQFIPDAIASIRDPGAGTTAQED